MYKQSDIVLTFVFDGQEVLALVMVFLIQCFYSSIIIKTLWQ